MFTESFEEAWRLRYGVDPDFARPETAPFLRHRSIRRYREEPIDEATMSALIAAGQSASTSSTLQLWSVVSVQNAETRDRIATLCDNYDHIRRAAWFLCFIADHHRLREAARRVGEEAAGLPYAEFFIMAIIDAALAAERIACAAETQGIGVCYIGALRNHPPEIKEILGLPDGTFAQFGMCLGWPEEPIQSEIKPRLSQDSIWFRERYETEVDVSDYDRRMTAFYESQKMKGEVTWSMRSGRRVDEHHMAGREVLLEWVRRQGFLAR